MASFREYEFIEAILIKAVTEKSAAARDSGAAIYHEAMVGMDDEGERSADNQVAVGGCRRPDGIYFSVERFADAQPSFGKWHRLPTENSTKIERMLEDVGQIEFTIIANRQVLQEFM